MNTKNETKIKKTEQGHKLLITREFNAPKEHVWDAWTQSELLDQWWAPKPWKAVTKEMEFTDGGHWLYYMAGPEGEKHYCKEDFSGINAKDFFAATAFFCDENGDENPEMPKMYWENTFSSTATGSKVDIDLSFDNEEAMNTIVGMGFKEGFTSGLENLDELLAK